jgi:hypothetical protein
MGKMPMLRLAAGFLFCCKKLGDEDGGWWLGLEQTPASAVIPTTG